MKRVIAPSDGAEPRLQRVDAAGIAAFKSALQAAFRVAAEADLGQPLDEPIPSDQDIEQSLRTPGAVADWIMAGDRRVGGAVVVVDEASGRNVLAFFFIDTGEQSRGLGLKAWQAIERAHPATRVWETVTPYFEKRNIHFYVNRCGFSIVEFYNRHHPDPHRSAASGHGGAVDDGDDEMFRFEKRMAP